MFSSDSDHFISISPYFDIISLFAAEVKEPKTGLSGKGVIHTLRGKWKCPQRTQRIRMLILGFPKNLCIRHVKTFKKD